MRNELFSSVIARSSERSEGTPKQSYSVVKQMGLPHLPIGRFAMTKRDFGLTRKEKR